MNRRGFTIVELIVAGALLATLLAVCLKMFVSWTDWRRESDRRRLALLEVANVMERLAATPWDDLTPEGGGDMRISEHADKSLPNAKLTIDVSASPPDQTPPSKRLALSLEWRDRAGRMSAPIEIVTWRFLNPPDQPPPADSS